MDRSKVAAGALLAAVFVSGLIVGGVGSSALEDRKRDRERRTRTPYIEMLQDSLGLRADQRPTIEAALEEFYANWRTVSRELQAEERRRTQEFRVELRSTIAATLDSSQAETYRRIIARSDSIRAERRRR